MIWRKNRPEQEEERQAVQATHQDPEQDQNKEEERQAMQATPRPDPEHQDQPRSKKIHQDFLEEGETLHSQQAKEETDAEPKPRPPAKTGINAQSLKQSRKRRHKKKRKKEEQAKKKGRKKENITKWFESRHEEQT